VPGAIASTSPIPPRAASFAGSGVSRRTSSAVANRARTAVLGHDDLERAGAELRGDWARIARLPAQVRRRSSVNLAPSCVTARTPLSRVWNTTRSRCGSSSSSRQHGRRVPDASRRCTRTRLPQALGAADGRRAAGPVDHMPGRWAPRR
jgi:hypothetical protein